MFSRLGFVALVVVVATSATTLTTDAVAPAAASEDVTLTCFPHAPTGELRFDNTYGAGRSGGRRHKGTDIMSPKGLEVRAVADGVVATLGNGRSSGYYVRLVHAGGWETWYMHLANDTPGTDDGRGGAETAYADGLTEGAFVRAGQVIGRVGDSGNAEWTGSHTHFELHIGGRTVNPYAYLVDVFERESEARKLVTGLVFTPDTERADLVLDQTWERLAELGTAACLPDSHDAVVRRLYGRVPDDGLRRVMHGVR
jgi:hypothetical protein